MNLVTHIEKGCRLISDKLFHVLEFGVFTGGTIKLIKDLMLEKHSVFGFDSFEGLPEDWIDKDGKIAGDGSCVKGMFTTNGEIPNISGITFYKGWFEDTIPKYLNLAKPIALLHIDCDLYSSTKTVLYGLNDYIVKDTIIIFDEWFYCSINGNENSSDHEQKCFYEWVNDFNREYELIEHFKLNNNNEQQIVKILK